MSLKDIDLKPAYNSDADDILNKFYIPALSESIVYKRLAGYFTSNSLAIAAKGISKFILNGGRIQLIANVVLSKEDYEKIKEVSERPFLEKIEKEFIESLENLQDELIKDHVKMLGWMLRNKKLEIKISLVQEGKGIQHQKTGILEDREGNILSFTGSDNETKSGWINNIEKFHVFCNWKDGDKEHLSADLNGFEEAWNDRGMRSRVYPVSKAIEERLIRLAPENDKEFERLNEESTKQLLIKHKESLKSAKKVPILRPFQKTARENWIKNSYRGIFEMATGTGKTITALGCLDSLLEDTKRPLLVVISCPFQHLITQWKENVIRFGIDLEMITADSTNSKWRSELIDGIYNLKNGIIKGMIVLTTHDTFGSSSFTDVIQKVKVSSLVIVDEVHGIGADQRQRGLISAYDFRLGLSATPERWFDKIGTQTIRDFFGKTVFELSLKEAINTINPDTGKSYLVKYDYKPLFVELSDSEVEEYEKQTKKIARALIYSKNNAEKEGLLELLYIKRQKIIINAQNKMVEFEGLISSLKEINHCLIYCSPQQIVLVQDILNHLGILQHRFTNKEKTKPEKRFNGISEREYLLDEFSDGKYPVLVAMKCLDEGVDVPQAKMAIILASSGNPKEYIQRRGRILRPYPGKNKAVIYDLVVVPPITRIKDESLLELEKKILEKELIRYKEFADASDNKLECLNKIYKVQTHLMED